MKVFLGFGSNLGEREENCEKSIDLLLQNPEIASLKKSSLYSTKAICLPGERQPDFINGVVSFETTLEVESLYHLCKSIEEKLGRRPTPKRWQPRPIDLDILFYGNQIVETQKLKIPHPLLHERLFVLEPLNEIAPDFVHPIFKINVAKLLQNMLKNGA